MKVTTDACIQGAWTCLSPDAVSVLDIGAGTGILALMLAQRYDKIIIDAIELEGHAAQQAKENVLQSPWRDRINILEGDAVSHPYSRKYNHIITNPPFFNNSLLGENDSRNAARHTTGLNSIDLLTIFEKLLTQKGTVSILLPQPESKAFNQLAETKGWFIQHELLIRHGFDKPVKRVVTILSKSNVGVTMRDSLTIKGDGSSYTNEFIDLLKPFYLAF